MKKIWLLFLICVCYAAHGQTLTDNTNCIVTTTYTKTGGQSPLRNVTYYDGLGRQIQSVDVNIGPSDEDNVVHIVYDQKGNITHHYIPYAIKASNGQYRPNAITENAQFNNSSFVYFQNIHEKSPLNRLQSQKNVGESRSTTLDYQATAAGEVMKVKALSSGTSTNLVMMGYYAANTLYKNSVTNVNGTTTTTYIDMEGRVVMEKVSGTGIDNRTHYAHDYWGNLCYVLPPELSAKVTTAQAELDNYAYQYKYDSKHRCIEKKLPGAEWEYYVYDKGDRMMMKQDAYWRNLDRWQIYFYDAFDRVTEVWARKVESTTRENMQRIMDNRNNVSSGLGEQYIIESYKYDNYTGVPDNLNFAAVTNVVTTSDRDTRVTASLTYEKKAILSTPGIGAFPQVERAYYYDYMGRVIQTVEKNHLGGISRTSFKYDFVGNVLTKHESHQSSATATADILLTNYTYDHAGRLKQEITTLNNGTAARIDYTYKGTGRLNDKIYANNSSLREMYSYYTQGWEASRTNPLFSMKLRYGSPIKDTPRQYGGNITEWEWSQRGSDVPDGSETNTYGFTYDAAGRLTDAKRYIGTSTTASINNTEKDLTYDKNGNIKTLKRYGSTGALADNLTYTYTGNQLTSIRGTSTATYTYDGNGNMTRDGKRDLNIEYNYLNLASTVSAGGSSPSITKYKWSADGSKLSTTNGNNGYEYLGSLIYQRQNGILSLESAAFGEGRIYKASTGYNPHYFFTDHLGSPRVIVNQSGTVQSRMNYYPFGKLWEGGEQSTNRWNYNNKETQQITGHNIIDYGARMYDPDLGRWPNMDPLADKYYSIGPYVYTLNNPIRFIDPNGMW